MLLFCPSCSNVLTVSTVTQGANANQEDEGDNRLECKTCPYQYVLKKRYYERKHFKRVEREDIFGGPEEWANAQKAKTQCSNAECSGEEAAYYQVQIRSADEPMTSFYKCMTCHTRWREN